MTLRAYSPRLLIRRLDLRTLRVAWIGLAVSAIGCAAGLQTPAASAGADVQLDARLLQMADERRVDTAVIDAVLQRGTAPQRARAALAIGQTKARVRYDALRRLLVDADTLVAANAAYALGLAKDSESVIGLTRAVSGAPDAVAREAAWSLGEIGEPARTALAVALGDGISQPLVNSTAAQRRGTVRAALLLATAKLRPVPFPVLRPWFGDTDIETVRAAAYAIGRTRVAAGVRALLSVRASKDEDTRAYVARGLSRQAAGDSLSALARAALDSLRTDVSAHVRVNALQSFATFGVAAQRAIDVAFDDPDGNVRVTAAEGAATAFAQDSLLWARAWTRDSTFRVRQLLLTGARTAGSTALSAMETSWASSRDWRQRLTAFEARTAVPKDDRVALIRHALDDADPRVRAGAFAAIPASASDSLARVLVSPGLADADIQVRAAALGVLARRARAEDLESGLAAFARAATDADGDARTAALRVVANAWTRDSARVSAETRRALATFARAATPAERRLVARVTPMLSWATHADAGTTRPLAEYEQVVRRWMVPGARQPRAIIRTDRGDITIELLGRDAPLIVEAFVRLATSGFYRNTTFHRVVPNFVVQDGDPRGDGNGGPGFSLRESASRQRHERGAVGLATSGPDTGGSQYYLCLSAQPHLDGAYTVFGRVIDGMAVMDRLVQSDRMLRIEIR
jgi:cyclophilin family peptidyl-prolyl cis-trans isomerase/HEAT repeat protein